MKHGYRTTPGHRGFRAYGITYRRHTYGKHTRLGKRAVWTEMPGFVDLGEHPTREEARAAGKAWVKGKVSAGTPQRKPMTP